MEKIMPYCDIHGPEPIVTKTRRLRGKLKQVIVCEICIRDKWKKAAAKYRSNPKNKNYYKNYFAEYSKIRKCLSVYLTMILIMLDTKLSE